MQLIRNQQVVSSNLTTSSIMRTYNDLSDENPDSVGVFCCQTAILHLHFSTAKIAVLHSLTRTKAANFLDIPCIRQNRLKEIGFCAILYIVELYLQMDK